MSTSTSTANKKRAQPDDGHDENDAPSTAIATSSKPAAKAVKAAAPQYTSWRDVRLDGEDTESVPIYDDCSVIRRKITEALASGVKAAQLLRDWGGINSNSLARFKKESGANGGAANQVYYAAYVYFEKVRIFEGKPKTPARVRNENEHPGGFEREQRRYMWVMGNGGGKRRKS